MRQILAVIVGLLIAGLIAGATVPFLPSSLRQPWFVWGIAGLSIAASCTWRRERQRRRPSNPQRPILDRARTRIVPLPVPGHAIRPTPPWNRPPPHLSRKRRSTLAIAPPAPEWCRSAAGTCPSNTRASSTSTWPCGRAPGLFDVSHMGEIEIAGKDALAAVQRISSNDASKLQVGQAQYSGLPDAAGHVRGRPARLSARPRALPARRQRRQHREGLRLDRRAHQAGRGDAVAVDASSRYALLAVQGPEALDVLQPLTGVDLAGMKYYWFAHGEVANVRATISRTGYTGEDGFEIFVPPQSADRVWQAILEAGRRPDLIPCGLGARDTLRLEAGDAPLRQRHRRHDDRARSRPGLDRRLEEGRLHRRRRPARAEGERRPPQDRRLRDARPRHRPPRLRRLRRRRESRRRHQRHADARS